MSFTKKIKDSVKKAVSFIQDFEDHAIRLGIDQGYDFVVCGHIHKPQIRKVEMEKGSITYLNSGDWIENLTALEYCWGEWSLYEYDESDFQYVNTQLRVPEAEGVEDLEEDDMDSGVSTQEIFQQILKTGSEA